MKKTTIVFTSGGQNWVPLGLVDTTGKMLGQPIHEIEIDASTLPDPVANPEMKHVMGIRQKAVSFVLGNDTAKHWINQKAEQIIEKILECEEPCILHVAVRCRGGFQRSVVVADVLAEKTKSKLTTLYKEVPHIIVAHLTLPLVLAVRQQHFDVNSGESLVIDDIVKTL